MCEQIVRMHADKVSNRERHMDFGWQASLSEIERVQRERKWVAVEQALRAPFHESGVSSSEARS
jgi:hypothetical protein